MTRDQIEQKLVSIVRQHNADPLYVTVLSAAIASAGLGNSPNTLAALKALVGWMEAFPQGVDAALNEQPLSSKLVN